MNYKKIFKRETKVIAYVIVALTIVLLGSSYALFFKVKEDTNNQIVQAGALSIEYSDPKTITATNGVIECLRPQTDDEAKDTACSFEFTITNKGNLPSQYNIYVYDDKEGTATNAVFVNHQYIKYTLRKQIVGKTESTLVGDKEAQLLSTLKEVNGKRLAETNNIAVGQSITFSLKFWIDDDAPASIIGQNIQLGLDVDNVVYEEATAAQTLKTSMSINSGLMKIESIKTAEEENKEYRYTGVNPNNYVYFNCQDESDLSTCEKWRILGIYNTSSNSQTIKLINTNSDLLKEWDTNSSKTYNTASLKNYLNNDYFNTLSASARSKIISAPFYLNGADNYNITGEDLLKLEQASVDKEELNVGLMTLSDYALASGITNNLDNSEALKNTWLFTGKSEWLINKNTNNEIYTINESGAIETSDTNIQKLVRPVVYLNSDIKIVNGDGSIDNPYILQ